MGVNTGEGVIDLGHLLLVCGYGICGTNQYLLVYDSEYPDNRPFKKLEYKILYGDDKPIRLWTLKVDSFINSNEGIKKVDENELAEIQTEIEISNSYETVMVPYFNMTLQNFINHNLDENQNTEYIEELNMSSLQDFKICRYSRIPYKKGLIELIEIDDDRIQNVSLNNTEIIDIESANIRLLKIRDQFIPIDFPEKFDLNDHSYDKNDLIERIKAKYRSATIIFNK